MQREQIEMPISHSSHERGIFAYFKSCCPRLLISLHLSADIIPFGTLTSLAHSQLLRAIKNEVCLDNPKGLRELRTSVGLINKFILLHETKPSRLKGMAVLSKTWKPIQRVEENDTGISYK